MTPVTVYYKLTAPFTPAGSYLESARASSARTASPRGRPELRIQREPAPPHASSSCQDPTPTPVPCLTAHGYQGYGTYQPASRFWAFQGIETGIFVILAAILLAVTLLGLEPARRITRPATGSLLPTMEMVINA